MYYHCKVTHLIDWENTSVINNAIKTDRLTIVILTAFSKYPDSISISARHF